MRRESRALSESGLEIGAHTYNHVRIDRMSYADALREVESRKKLPVGRYHGDCRLNLLLPERKNQ